MKPDNRSVWFCAAACSVLLAAGCVEPFGGSNIQVTFADTTQIPGDRDPDDREDDGRPPPDTHYMFVAVRSGADPQNAFAFEVADFDIVPIVTPSSPCFIEIERTDFPGLHSTQLVNKLRAELDVPEGAEFDPGTPMESAVRVLTAERRVSGQVLLSNTLKAVVAHTPFRLAPVADDAPCANEAGYDPARFPANTCIDDESSAARLALCRAVFSAHPNYYEGNDQVLSIPLNGTFLGAVEGRDVRNQQIYGGAQFFVGPNLDDIDSLLVNFQYNCSVEDFQDPAIGPERCEPQYPDSVPESQRTSIGFHYMSGVPVRGQLRGVARVTLRNRVFQSIRAEAAVYTDLDDDDVNF